MTPDLTTAQTIGLASAIVGFCLTVFFTTLIVLTYGHQIRQYLRRRGVLVQPRPQTPAHLPFHYVLPFQQPEPARRQLADLAPIERQPTTAGPFNDAPQPTSPRRPRNSYRIGRSLTHGTPPLDPAMFQPRPPTTGTYWPGTRGPTNIPPPTPNLVYRSGLWYPNRPRPRMEHPRPIPVFLDNLFRDFPIDFADRPILIPRFRFRFQLRPRN